MCIGARKIVPIQKRGLYTRIGAVPVAIRYNWHILIVTTRMEVYPSRLVTTNRINNRQTPFQNSRKACVLVRGIEFFFRFRLSAKGKNFNEYCRTRSSSVFCQWELCNNLCMHVSSYVFFAQRAHGLKYWDKANIALQKLCATWKTGNRSGIAGVLFFFVGFYFVLISTCSLAKKIRRLC